MNADTTFLDCPAYTDRGEAARCGLPAAVEDRYSLGSTDGAVTAVRIRCPKGHWFNGPVDALTVPVAPVPAATLTVPVAPAPAASVPDAANTLSPARSGRPGR